MLKPIEESRLVRRCFFRPPKNAILQVYQAIFKKRKKMHFFQHFLKILFFSKFCKIWKNFVHSSVHAVHTPVSHMYTCTPKIGGTPEYNFLQFFANFLQKIFRNFNLRFSHNQGGFGTGVKIFCKFSLFCIFRKHISLGGKTPKKRVCKKRNEMAFF